MRKTSNFWIYTLAITGVFFMMQTSCKKDSTTTNPPATVAGKIKDYDGNTYDTIRIGTQTWFKQNLKVTHYRNGVAIATVTDNTAWDALTTGAYCNYNNTASLADTYDRLYNWYAVNDSRNIAPAGWHVATDAEWTTLITYLGTETVAGGKLKEVGTAHWLTPNTGATNSSGFTGLPGGNRTLGVFGQLNTTGSFWCSTEDNTVNAWYRSLFYVDNSVNIGVNTKSCGFSVRCIKD